MDFTREPIVETVITPREGHKLVVRSSKGSAQEEYFVDAVEVVSFGQAFFFRSIEKPKSFLLPVIDYEVLEVREARMVLKHVGIERSIKIGGGRQTAMRAEKSPKKEEKPEEPAKEEESRSEKRPERRKHYRRRRSKDEKGAEPASSSEEQVQLPDPKSLDEEALPSKSESTAAGILRSILSPPPLISETIGRYRKEEKKEPPAPEEPSEKKETEDLWDFSEELSNDPR